MEDKKNTRGRRKISPEMRRSELACFGCTPEQYEMLYAESEKRGQTLAAFLREIAFKEIGIGESK